MQAFTEEQKRKLKEHYTVCIKSTGANPELVKKARGGDFNFEDDKVKSYVFCVMKRIGLLSDTAAFRKDVALGKLEEAKRDQAGKAIDNCLARYKKENASSDQLAWNFLKCYQSILPGNPII